MKTKNYAVAIFVLLTILMTSCTPNAIPQPQSTSAASPTATISVIETSTPPANPTTTSLPLPTIQTGCTDSALYVEDVTIPDNTNLKAGESFTKTWRLRNTGKCIWNVRYALVFVGGEQMGGAVTTPLSETPPGETLDISIKLTAPGTDGQYTGLYELRTPQGRAISIGSVTSIWVKITVGKVSLAAPVNQAAAPAQNATPVATAQASGPCTPQENGGLTAEVFTLINTARADARLQTLNLDAQLNTAAQAHSNDMACHNFASHSGSDGSSIHARVVAAGYAPSYSEEIIFPGGAAQDAFNWWINDKTHRDAILNPNARDIGIGYAYLSGTAYGSYLTVDFGAP